MRDGANPATRPVLFAFNGGPIVASAYVHVGGLGPRRAAFPDDIAADPAKVTLADNPASPLDAADLVFVDPASTGFSTVAPGTDPHAFWSVRADAAQVAAFIRAWLAAHGRTGAPVYVLGESYGTNRACEIARQLAQGPIHCRWPAWCSMARRPTSSNMPSAPPMSPAMSPRCPPWPRSRGIMARRIGRTRPSRAWTCPHSWPPRARLPRAIT
jgi:hypothetical protein